MEKNSKRSAKLIVVLIALLLIACSLLGFTLARYYTQGDDSQGGVNIAQWDIDVDDATTEGAGTVTAMLSPNMREYDNTIRTRVVSAANATALVITNNSDVKATVTITITDGLKYYSNTAGGDGAYPEIDPDTGIPQYAAGNPATNPEWQSVDLDDIIKFGSGTGSGISVTYGTAGAADGTTVKGTAGSGTDAGKTIYTETLEANGGWMKVTLAEITWTSDFDSDDDSGAQMGEYGDLRDTWIGENVGSVGFAYTWKAEQASELPDGGTSNPSNP